jgi:hypothetical protein
MSSARWTKKNTKTPPRQIFFKKQSMNRTTKYTVELTDKEKQALYEVYDAEFIIDNFGDSTIANVISQIVVAGRRECLKKQQGENIA